MENITININGEAFEFAGEVLMRHMRKIQPLATKQEAGELGALDFMIEIAVVLCVSENKNTLEKKLDNLNMKWIEDFTEKFEKVMNGIEGVESKKK